MVSLLFTRSAQLTFQLGNMTPLTRSRWTQGIQWSIPCQVVSQQPQLDIRHNNRERRHNIATSPTLAPPFTGSTSPENPEHGLSRVGKHGY